MTIKEEIGKLEESVERFKQLIGSLSPEAFLRRFTEWAPRDVLAHLIGWNRYTLEGSEQIRRGETPPFFIDPGENFSRVNAALVQKYSTRDKGELFKELDVSLGELKQYLASLDSIAWEKDFGVKYEGSPVTIGEMVEALIEDYVNHREQIEMWTQSVGDV